MKIKGQLSLQDLKDKIQDESIETVIVGFTDHYGRLLGKRFDARFFWESCVENGTHACDYLLTTDMEMEPVPGFASANWELGYGDFHLMPDIDTLRVADWLDRTAIVLCNILDEKLHTKLSIAPRSILLKQVELLKKEGFHAFAASELEYYLFENSFRAAHESNYHNLKTASYYLEDYHIMQGSRTEYFTAAARRHLNKSGVPVENYKGEWGLGQHELNVRYAEILEMADRHVIFKQCLKELADSKELALTFMAKFHKDRAGSSCHIHLSLWDGDDNLFVGDQELGPVKVSDTFRWFLGGWIKYANDVMPFYAPTVNSYKRFADSSWAPTGLAWSYDNRTAGFRIVGKGKSLRIECRIPGADCNPYLAFGAALACGMAGIKKRIEPPEIFNGDSYKDDDLKKVPLTLKEANAIFKESTFAKEVFGEKVVKHYGHHFDMEVLAYEQSVTDWERKRYFERI